MYSRTQKTKNLGSTSNYDISKTIRFKSHVATWMLCNVYDCSFQKNFYHINWNEGSSFFIIKHYKQTKFWKTEKLNPPVYQTKATWVCALFEYQ